MAHRVAENPGEMLGQEDGLNQDDHRQRLGADLAEEAARKITAQEVGQGYGQSRNSSPR